MTYLLRNIPPELWRRFRSACALEGVTAKAKILELITKYLERGK
jgi:hypothetical protein